MKFGVGVETLCDLEDGAEFLRCEDAVGEGADVVEVEIWEGGEGGGWFGGFELLVRMLVSNEFVSLSTKDVPRNYMPFRRREAAFRR